EHARERIMNDMDFYDHKTVPEGDPKLPPLPADVTLDALDRRRTLLEQINEAGRTNSPGTGVMTRLQQQAFDLISSQAARQAFDLTREPPTVRDRYGRGTLGASVLLA